MRAQPCGQRHEREQRDGSENDRQQQPGAGPRAGDDRAQPPELCWDKMKFRTGLLQWIDSLGVPGLGVSAPLVS